MTICPFLLFMALLNFYAKNEKKNWLKIKKKSIKRGATAAGTFYFFLLGSLRGVYKAQT